MTHMVIITTLHFLHYLYKCAQKAEVLHYARLEMVAKHSSLLGSFISYEENEVLFI
jgi:hypothetical protein